MFLVIKNKKGGLFNLIKFFSKYFNYNYIFSETELITPPLDGTILEGVTRQSILDMTRKWVIIKELFILSTQINDLINFKDNIKVSERSITMVLNNLLNFLI